MSSSCDNCRPSPLDEVVDQLRILLDTLEGCMGYHIEYDNFNRATMVPQTATVTVDLDVSIL